MAERSLPDIQELEALLRKLAERRRSTAEIISFPEKQHRAEYEKAAAGFDALRKLDWEAQAYRTLNKLFQQAGTTGTTSFRKYVYAKARRTIAEAHLPPASLEDFERAVGRFERDVKEGRVRLEVG